MCSIWYHEQTLKNCIYAQYSRLKPRALGRDEFLKQAIALDQGRVAKVGEQQSSVRTKQESLSVSSQLPVGYAHIVPFDIQMLAPFCHEIPVQNDVNCGIEQRF